jgi:nucleoside-diphosphate-sugar epimerase
VFHVAGVTKALAWKTFEDGNVYAARRLCEAAIRACPTARFIHFSSAAVTGPSYAGVAFTEEVPFNPITPYGRSKAAGEEAVWALRDDIAVTVLRPPTVYGPRERDLLQLFQTARRHVRPLIGGGRARVQMIAWCDLVEATIAAALSPDAASGRYFVADNVPYSTREIAEMAAALIGTWTIPVYIPGWALWVIALLTEMGARVRGKAMTLNRGKLPEILAPSWLCSTSRAKQDFGFIASTSLADGMAQTVAWYREQGWL